MYTYCYRCVTILLCMCHHTTVYVSSYYYTVCVLMLLYMCPHATLYVSSYYYIYAGDDLAINPDSLQQVFGGMLLCPDTMYEQQQLFFKKKSYIRDLETILYVF